jgi:hypothetical protein
MSTEKTSLENENQPSCLAAVSGSTWDDLWQEFIEDCEKSNKTIIEASDFFFWLDFGFKVPERL